MKKPKAKSQERPDQVVGVMPASAGIMAPKRMRFFAEERAAACSVVPALDGTGIHPRRSAPGVCRTPRRMRRSALFFCLRPGRACPKNSPARPSTLFESGPPSFLGFRNASPRSFVPCSAAPPRNPGGPLSPTSALAGFSSRAQTGARCTSPDASHSRSRPGRPSLEQTGIRPWGASVPCEPRGRVSHLSGFCLFRPTSLTRTGPRAAGTAFGCSGERGACRPSLDGSAIAAHRIALADPFGRLGSLACSAKRRHLGRVTGRPPKQLLAVSEKPEQLLAVPKSRGACRPSLDGSAIAAHRIALADPFGRLGSLACSAKRRHLGRVTGRPPKQLLAVSEKPEQLLAVPKSRGACRPSLDGSAIAAHRIALADPFGRLGSLACSAKRRHLKRVAGLPPKQLLAVSEKLGADFASLDGFALRFTSHRLRRPLQAADLLARLVKRRSLHCVPGRPIETACGCFARAGELHRPVQLSATKARRNQTPVPDCPAETACGCFRGPEQLQAVRSREMSKEREID